MAYYGSWKIDDNLTFVCNTHSPTTAAATDADAVPSYRVYEDETGTAILTGSMAKLDDANTTGFYSEQIALSAANGFEKGKCYTIYISATVLNIAGTMHHSFQIEAEVDANTVSDKNNYSLSQAFPSNFSSLSVDSDGRIDVIKLAGTSQTARDLGLNIDTTISSRSSHSAADVWSVGTRTLTSFGSLVSDIWSNASRTLTAISDSAGITTLLSRISAALNISSGRVEANIKQINDTDITGDGSGTPWGPA